MQSGGSSGGGRKKVGTVVLKEQLKELRQESAVLMELQNRLDKSIETLKTHKKHVVVTPQHGGAGTSSMPTPSSHINPILENQERTLTQFINNLSGDGFPQTQPRAHASPFNQRRLHFGGTGDLAPDTISHPLSTSRKRMVLVPSYADDDLTTRTEYQQKLCTNSVELESATNRMAKQELEIFNLRQKCVALERAAAIESTKASGSGPPSLAETPAGRFTTPAAAMAGGVGAASSPATFAPRQTADLDEDSKILKRWGFAGKPKDQNAAFDYSKASAEAAAAGGGSPMPSARKSARQSPTFGSSLPFTPKSNLSPIDPPVIKSSLLKSAANPNTTSGAFTFTPRRDVYGQNATPSSASRVRERFLESELIKRDRELSAVTTALDDYTTSDALAHGPSAVNLGQRKKSERERLLENEMDRKNEVSSPNETHIIKTSTQQN